MPRETKPPYDPKAIRAGIRENLKHGAPEDRFAIGPLQVAIFTAVGGGILGRTFAESPAEAYVDGRVGRLPYSRTSIERMRLTLVILAEELGLDPKHLPTMPRLHSCNVF